MLSANALNFGEVVDIESVDDRVSLTFLRADNNLEILSVSDMLSAMLLNFGEAVDIESVRLMPVSAIKRWIAD